jgi:hypothetical protein
MAASTLHKNTTCRFCGIALRPDEALPYHITCVEAGREARRYRPLWDTTRIYGNPPRPLTWG